MLLGMAGEEQYRCRPNILICGTPGTGKSITSQEVATRTGLHLIDVGMVAKENNLFEGWDEQYECPILDEDKVLLCVWTPLKRLIPHVALSIVQTVRHVM